MTEQDLDEVMRIEEASFSSPWSRGMFLTELKDNPFSTLLVARPSHSEIDSQPKNNDQALPVRGVGTPEHLQFVSAHGPPHLIVGYSCFWMIFGEAHILNLAVHPDWRRKGIAAQLVEEMLSMSRSHGIQKIHLEVRRSNHAARRLYEKFGFREIAVRRNYYTHPREDALLMALDLNTHSSSRNLPRLLGS